MTKAQRNHKRVSVSTFEVEEAEKPRMASRLSCVGVLWALLSFASMGLSSVGFYMPFWLNGTMKHNDTPTYLGLFRRCNYLRLSEHGKVELVLECGRYTDFEDIPSLWWQIGTVAVGVGCGLLVMVSCASILGCCISDAVSHTLAKLAGVFQFVAGLCIAAGCVLYPLGWEMPEVTQACGGTSDIYKLGVCTIGWAYYATIAGGSVAFMCSLLSCHAVKSKYYHRMNSSAR